MKRWGDGVGRGFRGEVGGRKADVLAEYLEIQPVTVATENLKGVTFSKYSGHDIALMLISSMCCLPPHGGLQLAPARCVSLSHVVV